MDAAPATVESCRAADDDFSGRVVIDRLVVEKILATTFCASTSRRFCVALLSTNNMRLRAFARFCSATTASSTSTTHNAPRFTTRSSSGAVGEGCLNITWSMLMLDALEYAIADAANAFRLIFHALCATAPLFMSGSADAQDLPVHDESCELSIACDTSAPLFSQ